MCGQREAVTVSRAGVMQWLTELECALFSSTLSVMGLAWGGF